MCSSLYPVTYLDFFVNNTFSIITFICFSLIDAHMIQWNSNWLFNHAFPLLQTIFHDVKK